MLKSEAEVAWVLDSTGDAESSEYIGRGDLQIERGGKSCSRDGLRYGIQGGQRDGRSSFILACPSGYEPRLFGVA